MPNRTIKDRHHVQPRTRLNGQQTKQPYPANVALLSDYNMAFLKGAEQLTNIGCSIEEELAGLNRLSKAIIEDLRCLLVDPVGNSNEREDMHGGQEQLDDMVNQETEERLLCSLEARSRAMNDLRELKDKMITRPWTGSDDKNARRPK